MGIDRIRRTWAGQDAQGEGEGGSEDRISPRLLESADGVQEAPRTKGTLESRLGIVLVSQSCHNKVPQARWLKPQTMIY